MRYSIVPALACLTLSLSLSAFAADEDYKPGTDAMPKDGVPKGKLSQREWTSEIFPGTVRDYWVYVPAQYDGKTPAAVLICQDGGGFVRENGPFRAPTVLDNLIHAGDIPVTIGIFINPGVIPPAKAGQQARKNRSFEYDTLSDQYARFLLEEILPHTRLCVVTCFVNFRFRFLFLSHYFFLAPRALATGPEDFLSLTFSGGFILVPLA